MEWDDKGWPTARVGGVRDADQDQTPTVITSRRFPSTVLTSGSTAGVEPWIIICVSCSPAKCFTYLLC